jgi:hypothetical protein
VLGAWGAPQAVNALASVVNFDAQARRELAGSAQLAVLVELLGGPAQGESHTAEAAATRCRG